jgi:hypothetical protein
MKKWQGTNNLKMHLHLTNGFIFKKTFEDELGTEGFKRLQTRYEASGS